MINGFGYSIYRNVDKEATEAVESNAGKLVYNYSLGTTDQQDGTTDPSTIDAEASIKNGERKVLMIGTNVFGYFAIQKISQKFNRIDNRGNLLAIDIELNLMESQYDNRYSRNT